MPPVTRPDLGLLPVVSAPPPGPGAVRRPVVSRTDAPKGLEGEGFPVHRALAGVDLRAVDPFIMMDEMGAVDYAPGEPKGTPWHPHRGFETATYLIDGTFEHADSHGGGGTISDGDTQWMTAGSGVLHIERPPEWLVRSGGRFHGLQLWVNLPRAAKLRAPRYQDLAAGQVGLLASPDGGAFVRVIAGELAGVRGPGVTHTPILFAHATLAPGALLEVPWPTDYNALVYPMSGAGQVGPGGAEAVAVSGAQLAVLGHGDVVTLQAPADAREPWEIVLLGGRPLREPIAWAGPFVMNTRAEVLAAFEDYAHGRFAQQQPPDAMR